MKDEHGASIRLFFALWPEAAARAALLDARGGSLQDARPTRPNDLHLTLVFIGDVDPERLSCIEAAGDDVVLGGFALTLDRVETWPRQRLLAAVPSAPPPELFNLLSQLQHNLMPCGIQPEPRRFRPHVTLARKAARREPAPLGIDWPVREFVLARSGAPGSGGYRVLRSWLLD
jgi:2'-5' RNA ligase